MPEDKGRHELASAHTKAPPEYPAGLHEAGLKGYETTLNSPEAELKLCR